MGVTCTYCGGSDDTHHGTCPQAQAEQLEEQRMELLAAEASVSNLMRLLAVERAQRKQVLSVALKHAWTDANAALEAAKALDPPMPKEERL